MTEDEAQDWLRERWPHRMGQLTAFVALLREETAHQNLIAHSTLDKIWARHIVDSAQLLVWATDKGQWLDVGTGGGLPGLVIAILRDGPVTLAEPRKRRSDFLADACMNLELSNVTVARQRVELLSGEFSTVSARAYASLAQTFATTQHLVSRETVFILPRGRSAPDELQSATQEWQGSFHVEHSVTDPESRIVVARDVHR